jgi:hypothetical protein
MRGAKHVSIEIEINLRIPAVKDPLKNSSGWPINNGEVRFTKHVNTPTLPKPGDVVELMTQPNHKFEATVTRADWHEEKEIFIVSCKYAKQSIPRPHYLALMEDHEWTMKPLLD